MALSLVTAPATEPLTIAEVKAHLRMGDSDGEPAPTLLTAALATIPAAGNCENGTHRYLATFVTADGETDAGLATAAVTVADKTVNGQISLTAIPIGGSAVTARKIYRQFNSTGTFKLQSTISNNTATTATDNVANASLGADAPSTNTTADPELVNWITAARQYCETFTHRAFITQTWDLAQDVFPGGFDSLWIPKPPLVSVTSVSYVDQPGVTQTWSASLYTVDAPVGPEARKGRLYPAYLQIYPVTRAIENAVTVRFVAGYGAAASSVPAPIKAAMKLLIGNWWMNREAAVIARASADVLPLGVEALLWPFKAF